MELFISHNEYGLKTFHVGANGAYYITYSEISEEALSSLMASEDLFVPAPNFWGDAFKDEFVDAAKHFPEAAELILYHKYMDEDDLEGLAWYILYAKAEDRKEFFNAYLHGYGVENIYEFVSKAPAKLIQILANIVKKL